jgi:predicted ATPase/DNA-binding SARP family transcriptional activator/DNA-binding CsgD family transcriptional regulator
MAGPRREAAEQRDLSLEETSRRKREVVRIWLLGGFRVSVGSRTVEDNEWRLRKAGSLIKLLALAPGHRLHREQVINLLWPDLNPGAAANNLHGTLHFARRVLEPTPTAAFRYLHLRDEWLALCPGESLWVDVEAFEDATAAARRTREPAAYRVAIDLYAGELLPEDRYEEWTEERREELRQLYLALLVEVAGLYEEREEYELAVGALQRVATNEPTDEPAHVGLMRLYAMDGQRHRALRQYEQFREALQKGPGSEPGAQSRRLYGEIRAGRFPVAHPPAGGPSPDDRLHNLPAARTRFIGREQEMLEVKWLLSGTRLLTLSGAGGCGKTRLALQVARELVGSYPDGVWFVEVAAISDPALVPRAVTEALGVHEQPGRPLVDTLVDFLRSRQMLLVLDNCEHLIYACARLADTLLNSCARLRVLATSREALGVAGEANWLVPSLTVPDAVRLPAVQGLTQYEAVGLFVDRTRSRLPTFVLTPENARAVVEICRRLDGIPLAIELATARIGALAVEQVAQRLEDSLGLLTGGSWTAEPRQQTLRATLDWSYELLGEPERKLFGRLSVFAGGWTLESAEAVGAGSGIKQGEVLDLLSRLVDKSLVVSEAGAVEGALRYRMLEPIRQYGHERLEASGEADAARRRHAAWFLALAERAEPELREQGAWLQRLGTEHGNLRAALQWSLSPEGPAPEVRAEMGLRLAAALAQGRFWSAYGPGEGVEWLERALARSSASPKSVRAKALSEAGWMAAWRGDFQRGVALLEENLTISKELEDKPGIAAALTQLGNTVLHLGDRGRVEVLREEAEALRRELVDRRAIAWLLLFLGQAALDRDGYERAVALLEEGLALFRELGDMRGIGMCLCSLGLTALEQGDSERAAALLEDALRVLRELRDKVGTLYCLLGAAGVASSRGQPARAARLWGATEAMRETIGLTLSPFHSSHYDYEGHLAAARSLLDEAAWEAAWADGRAMTPEQAIEYALGTGGEPPTVSAPQQEPSVGGHPVILTRREREVAALVAQGLSNRRIAEELVLSEHTVATHVREILKKSGFHSRAQIAARATEQQPLP